MATTTSPLAEILDSLRLQTSLISVARLRVPFGVSCKPTDSAILHAVVEGQAQLHADGEPPVVLRQGDLAILCRGHGHVVEDAPGRPTTSIAKLPLVSEAGRLPQVAQGGSGPLTRVVCGSFSLTRAGAHQALTRLLPPVLVVRSDEAPLATWLDTSLSMLDGQLGREQDGGQAAIRRLLDLLFLQAIRAWLARGHVPTEGWIGGLGDDGVAQALALVHRRPAGAWTTEELAQRVGMSRSTFHRRFKQLVGQAPATYLLQWRMACAVDLLDDNALSVSEVGAKVGYSSEDAFVRAFRRVWAHTPSAWRRGEALAATG